MSRQPPPPPPPPTFPEPFAHARSTYTGQNVALDPAYPQGGPGPGHVHSPQSGMPSHTGYPSQQYISQEQQYASQQYSSSQLSPTPSRRSTLAATPVYDHASLPAHPPAPTHLSGAAPYNPSFPFPAVPVRHPSTNPSGPPPPEPPHRAATMPMPVPVHAGSSMPYDMQSPNTMHSPPQPGIVGGPPPIAQGHSYRGVHGRNDDPSNFIRDEDLDRGRGGTRNSGEYMRDRSPPNNVSAGNQYLRCMICGRVVKRATVDYQRGYCPGGHMGQWQRA